MIHSDLYASDVKADFEQTMNCRSTDQFPSGLHKAKDRVLIFIRRWNQSDELSHLPEMIPQQR
jgi:hypothetical protein